MFLQLSPVLTAGGLMGSRPGSGADALRLIIRGLGLADGIQLMTFFSQHKLKQYGKYYRSYSMAI